MEGLRSPIRRLQFAERHDWIPSLGVQYFVGVDGLGLLMVLLSAILVPMAMLASWKMEEQVPGFISRWCFFSKPVCSARSPR